MRFTIVPFIVKEKGKKKKISTNYEIQKFYINIKSMSMDEP